MPGVLLLEGMVQTCGILARNQESSGAGERPRVGTLASVQSARFRHIVRPGALLVYRASLLVKAGDLYSFEASTFVDDVHVADAKVCLSIVKQL